MSPKRAFILLAIVVALALPLLSFDFGITEDEQLHNEHGKSILDYFLGKSDLATRHPIDASGKLTFAHGPDMRDLSGALNIYGGLFDLVCAATHRYLSPLGEFENRHFVNALFGVLLIVSAGLTARQVAGWRAGILAVLLMGLSPRIIGHSMNNPVDLPFAALYLFSICFMLRFVEELPRPSARVWIPLLVGIPLATDVRIAGLVLFFYLLLFAGLWHLPRLLETKGRGPFARSLGIALLLAAGAYLLVSLPWPLAHQDPLGTPLMAFRHLSRLETFSALDLYDGRWIDRLEIPWHFVPRWLMIGTPLFIPLGLLLSPWIFAGRSDPPAGSPAIDRRKAALLGFTSVFPVLFVILRQSNVYNDARHVLFAVPPLVVLCAIAFESILRWKGRKILKIVFCGVLAGTMLEPLSFMVRNHPNEGVYFSPLIGGVDGAWKRYETDFWGNSARQAVEWIQDNAQPTDGGPVRIRNWYGDQTKVAYYVAKRPGFEHVVAEEASNAWDYGILQTVECKFQPNGLLYWPPLGTVYEVMADDTPLCAVVLNHRNRAPESTLAAMRAWLAQRPTHGPYYSFGSTAYEMERYADALEAFRHAAALRPDDARTWHAIGLAHRALRQWDDLIEAGKKTLQIDPSMEAARDNLRFALRQRVGATLSASEAPLSETPLSYDAYVNRSLELYNDGRYAEALHAGRLALRKGPGRFVTYNNLCAYYNALQEWDAARDACEIALALKPDSELARNNLKLAMRRARPAGITGP